MATQPETEVVELTASKARIGKLTQRYQNGCFQRVSQDRNGPDKVTVADLDRRHNGDYKVAYVSDPLLVFTGQPDTTREELKTVMETHGVWQDSHSAIKVAHGDGYMVGYKSLPSHADYFDRVKENIEDGVERDMDALSRENSITAYLPHE